MIFSSFEFLFVFLPVTLIIFFWVKFHVPHLARWALVAASVAFYASWRLAYVPLLLGSAVFNYLIGYVLLSRRDAASRRAILIFGLSTDLMLLAYYKYTNFLIGVLPMDWHMAHFDIILPLGISFFTFTQITFLVDAYRRRVAGRDLDSYLLFVTYFPHLIAGPILHHRDMIPQFRFEKTRGEELRHLAIGVSIFFIGLFKKTFLADPLSPVVHELFDLGHPAGVFAAWTGVLGYTMQIYFDFSGYSDMACGLSYLFGVRLPINFNSPYKAMSISEFWRRWHMTLSSFLRDYLYIPLGGNRHGTARQYTNLLVTMLLGGLWHGAGWTFVFWGFLHGLYLVVNHAWRALPSIPAFIERWASRSVVAAISWLITFLGVTFAWVFFRAPDFSTAATVIGGLIGKHGWGVLSSEYVSRYVAAEAAIRLPLLLLIAVAVPNTAQLFANWDAMLLPDQVERMPARSSVAWSPSWQWAAALGVIAIVGLLAMGRSTEFLYFQF
jgi:D-alanyl-lipoteichoic acid acyltransferase DltB (MBOAT superfamily)